MPWTDVEISAERLTLRPFVHADKPAIVELRTSPEVCRYLGGPAGAEFAAEIRAATVGERWGVFGVAELETGQAIGSLHFDRGRGVLEVSYELMPTHWGQGLAQEALSAALGWAARELDEEDVVAVTQTANAASVALLGRLGFELERTFEEFDAEQGWFSRSLSA
jgi:RimJ/RimL family protein N-acetyltransferase